MEVKDLERILDEAEEEAGMVLNGKHLALARQAELERIRKRHKIKSIAGRIFKGAVKLAALGGACLAVWVHTPYYNQIMSQKSAQYASSAVLLKKTLESSSFEDKLNYAHQLMQTLDSNSFPGEGSIRAMLWLYDTFYLQSWSHEKLPEKPQTEQPANLEQKVVQTQNQTNVKPQSEYLNKNNSTYANSNNNTSTIAKTSTQTKSSEYSAYEKKKNFEKELLSRFDSIFTPESPSLRKYLPEMYVNAFSKSDWVAICKMLRAQEILTEDQEQALLTLADGQISNGEVYQPMFYMPRDKSAIYTKISSPYGQYFVKLYIQNISGNWAIYNQKCDLAKGLIFGGD